MTCRNREHLIGLALVPVLMLGLSACLPPEQDGLPPGSNSASPSVATPSQAGTAQADTTQTAQPEGTPSSDTPAETTPLQTSSADAKTATPEPTAVDPADGSRATGQPQETPGPQAPSREPTVVSWVPTGPIGQDDPDPGQRYLLLQQFQCDALAQSVAGATDAAVWLAGAAVCRALKTGSQEDWQRASAAVATTPRIPQRHCLEFRVAATSASVVAQYRSNPAGIFKAEPSPGEACPRQLLGLTVVDEDLRPVTGLTRASGPGTGGTIVRLDGYYVRVGEILFDGVPTVPDIVAGGGDYQTLYLRMPPADGRDTIRISITDTVDVAGTVTFFYDDSAVAGNTPHPPKNAVTPPESKHDGDAPAVKPSKESAQ
ncbi:hypothetical protein [Arthrobacter sp. M2012083]|uniref:hypothetical protein n=1 Tax=Arthrobacter sp. M2012083 TaxID=1197706 RepID=UPI0002D26B44|nr:hypothetical protein [Arthrobacter sp. M2012083]